ncbi:lysoplasmalogenase [Spirosoma utsteinense]|uniref:Membrane protein YhhN n=1 Tax=Spirosoma utsteinense TaxID=2585773 RepID=A0ABR6W961_9BACT|nr:lysoplasmalogenase [Spirosoma utsteinense]MBC3787335.1 putative membrane protein YhhN [Spirosoma utsteinense]MBC3793111.1 putative membrane protein YhhN [Spirosoma utsteinense]
MNTQPPTRLFRAVFVVVTLLEIAGDMGQRQWLHYGTKPLIVGMLLVWAWRHRTVGGRPMMILRIGLVFALLGDIFLMIQEVDLFGPGLASFLFMQLCYCAVFGMRGAFQSISLAMFGLISLPFALYAGVFLMILYPAFTANPALQGLWIPVIVYVGCISTMGLLAALRRGNAGYGHVLTGALLFILSDSAIAVNGFLSPFPGSTPLIMSTYAAAQYLIVSYIHPRQ